MQVNSLLLNIIPSLSTNNCLPPDVHPDVFNRYENGIRQFIYI
jgi:hypothetical protein